MTTTSDCSTNTVRFWWRTGKPTSWEGWTGSSSKGDAADGLTYDTSRLERHAEDAFDAGIRQIHLHAAGEKSASNPRSGQPRGSAGTEWWTAATVAAQSTRTDDPAARLAEPIPGRHHGRAVHPSRGELCGSRRTRAQAAPSVRVVEAVETEYLGKLDVYVPKLSHLNLWYPHFEKQRREQGGELWFYTCCHPAGRYPNRFLDQSLLKVRVLHWINYLYDLDGYLHWGLNHYGSDDPFTEDGISKDLPLGDRAIVYPGEKGMIGSLRFSAQRDGLQDYEYLWLLEDRLRAIKEQVGEDAFWLDPRQRSLELCRRVIWSFHDYTRDPNVLLRDAARDCRGDRVAAECALAGGADIATRGNAHPGRPAHGQRARLVPPGATVTLDGEPVPNVRPSGYFSHYWFPSDNTEC